MTKNELKRLIRECIKESSSILATKDEMQSPRNIVAKSLYSAMKKNPTIQM